MDLLKRNIHMDRIRAQAVSQITLEEDVNIPDSKPDVESISLEKAEVIIEEVKPGNDMVMLKGRLHYALLYHTQEAGSRLVSLKGDLPIDEKMNLQGVQPGDTVEVEGMVEDLTVGIINSRKLSIQSVMTLQAEVEELYDVEAPVGIQGEESMEYRRVPLSIAQLAIRKNDVFRIKEEITLPSNYPNIYQILWEDISLGDVEFKVQEERLGLQGDVHLFLLYEGEGEEHPIRTYDIVLPFGGALDCHGCKEGMLPDIHYHLGQQELAIRPDLDGEERCVGLELTLEIGIRIYEEEEIELLTDLYGVTKEIGAVTSPAILRRLLTRVMGKSKVADHIHATDGSGILQLLHSEGRVMLDQQTVVENGILLQGALFIKALYITDNDLAPYACVETQLPYEYTLEVPDMTAQDMGRVHAQIEQLQVTMLDSEEMDVKAVLCFDTTVFRNIPMQLIEQVTTEELDSAVLGNLPGMVIYVVKNGDNLWNIGRKYYVKVDAIREWNNLGSDELKIGQKLLIVKGGM